MVRTQKVVKDLGADLQLRYDVPVVRVYLSYAGADQHTAAIAPPWSTVPWHVLVLMLMDEAARRGIGALSPEAAGPPRLPSLDLVRSPRQSARLARLVYEFAARGYVPEALRGWTSAEDARRRWRALQAFYREHRHFLVTNGPYRLKTWSQTGVVLEAFRDLSYPLGVGSFDKEVHPRRAYLPTLLVRGGGRLEFRPDVERVMKFDRYYKLVREPLGSNTSGAIDDPSPLCRYVAVSVDGRVARIGTATLRDGRVYAIDLRSLPHGEYGIAVAVYISENYVNPDVRVAHYRKR